MSGNFLDGQIRAYRGKGQDNQLTRPSSIYFSTASMPPTTMDRIRHGELPDLRSELLHHYLLIESITSSSAGREYDSDSDLEDDKDGRSEQLNSSNAGSFTESFGRLYAHST